MASREPASSPSSRAAARRGRQEPRVKVERGEALSSDGDDAAELMAGMGMSLFPWQRGILNAWCARDSRDMPSYTTGGVSVPRQNGKNAVLEAYEFYELAICGAHVLHTAHRVKTAKKAFQRLVRYFNDRRHPDVSALVDKVRYTNGEEAIFLKNGGSIEFSARSRAGARGFDDIQIVVFDEAQDLTDDQLSAIMYTMAASSTGYRQMLYLGTPPDPSSPGTVFKRTRDRALGGDAERFCWHEWGCDERPRNGSTFADLLDEVYECNPSMGYTLSESFTEDEFGSADLEGFACERLGWWRATLVDENLALDPVKWDECSIPVEDAPKDGKMAFGVKFTSDGKTYALSAAMLGETPYVELIDVHGTSRGVSKLAEWLVERKGRAAAVIVDGRAGAQALLQQLRDNGMPKRAVMECSTKTAIAAASGFVDAVNSREVSHIASPAMDDSATKSLKRVIGRNGAFGFGDGIDSISAPVESAALALWAVKNTKRDPKRKARVHV